MTSSVCTQRVYFEKYLWEILWFRGWEQQNTMQANKHRIVFVKTVCMNIKVLFLCDFFCEVVWETSKSSYDHVCPQLISNEITLKNRRKTGFFDGFWWKIVLYFFLISIKNKKLKILAFLFWLHLTSCSKNGVYSDD